MEHHVDDGIDRSAWPADEHVLAKRHLGEEREMIAPARPGSIEQRGAFDGLAAAERVIDFVTARIATRQSVEIADHFNPHSEAERHCAALAMNGAGAAEVRAYRNAHRAAFVQRLDIFTADLNVRTAITEAALAHLQGENR